MGRKELRREPRQVFRRWVDVLVLGGEGPQKPQYMRCGACDLSAHGARLCMASPPGDGATLLVMFPRGQRGQNIIRFAHVRNFMTSASGWVECGVEFCTMPDFLSGQDLQQLFDAARASVADSPPDSMYRAA